MTVLIQILQLLLSLSILVLIHELGHFMFARLFKTRVEKLYLFFDPWFSLFKFKKGDTEYGIGWLPLGGYAKISGMIDESLDTEQMKQPPQPWEFRSKNAWQRLLIMTGGVLFNFILAMLIYVFVLFLWGETYLPTSNVKYGIVTDSTGHALGLMDGDKILTVDNQYIDNFYSITSDIVLNDRKTIRVDRGGQVVSINITLDFIKGVLKRRGQIEPRAPFGPYVISTFGKKSPARAAGVLVDDELVGLDNVKFTWFNEFQNYLAENKTRPVTMNLIRKGESVDIQVMPTAAGMLGIASNYRTVGNIFDLKTVNYGFLKSIPAGISKGFKSIADYLKQFKLIFSRDTKAYESLGGFIAIGSLFPGVWDWHSFWDLTAFLSIILAVMNILPIPGLDGGHVMFVLFELITGRKPSDKFLEYAQITGMILLFALLIFANGNDIIRHFRK